jgi:pyruvate-formate lyase-activating enzyme
MSLPYLVFADKKGKIYSHPYLRMAVSSLTRLCVPQESEYIRLPLGSSFFYLPGRLAVGFNPSTKTFEFIKEFNGRQVYAVGASLIPAYLRLYHPSYVVKEKKVLPLWAYTACGFYKGNFYACAQKIDSRIHQTPRFYDAVKIKRAATKYVTRYPSNRLYRHLAHCALNYNCLNAKNLFMSRWEAGIPTSSACNARCLGCLSYQASDCRASHQRIRFKPTAQEIALLMHNHLSNARRAMVSFGQGCEGEPLLEAETIATAIRQVRRTIKRGTIHMNTNASLPNKVRLLCQAGIDSFRVSINSADERVYNRYFRPCGYRFSDVIASIRIAKKYNKFVSLNLLILPGVSDTAGEIKALFTFIKETGIDMIQWRNLNIDPEYYLTNISPDVRAPRGIVYLIKTVAQRFPHLKMGYFNLPKEKFKSFNNLIK